MTTANDPWGRVDADGTVYVRTADGERVIGSWAAGSPEEALAFFRRKFASLETEVALIEQRIAATEIAPAQAQATVQRLLRTVADANCLGDLDGLRIRLEALTTAVDQRREEVKAAREHARVEARETKERIVEEAEHIAAEATHWKASGERMAELLEEWKAAPHADRAVEAVLWKRFRDAQDKFFAARTEVYAAKETELRSHAAVKEQLLAEAQSLLPVTDLRAARSSLRSIQERWEQAGPVPRELREQLESGLRKVEDSVRRAEDAQWRRSNPEALARAEGTVAQLRSAITSLEAQLARARDRGDTAGMRKAEEALEARRSWLTEAERTLAEFSSLSREPKGERG